MMKNRYKQAVDKKSDKKRRPISLQMRHRLREGLFLLTVAFALFLLVSLVTYHSNDPGWSTTGQNKHIVNWGGRVGAWLADIFLSLFGVVAYVFPFLCIFSSWLNLHTDTGEIEKKSDRIFKLLGWILVVASACALGGYSFPASTHFPVNAGGIVGDLLDSGLAILFNRSGSALLLVAILLSGITLVTGLSWLGALELLGARVALLLQWGYGWYKSQKILREAHLASLRIEKNEPKIEKMTPKLSVFQEEEEVRAVVNSSKGVPVQPILQVIAPTPLLPAAEVPVMIETPEPKGPAAVKTPMTVNARQDLVPKKSLPINSGIQLAPGTLPPFTLLNLPAPHAEKAFTQITFEELSALVEQRLADFGVEVKVTAVFPGPVITRFELDLAPGIKVSKITGLAKDIARSLSTVSVRVVEVIPGKSVIGLEIPNENRETVTLRDIVESQRYEQSRSPLSLVLGKDISGHPVVVDLAKMPHLLVAGTTGSGKSVSLNAMLLSMLFKATPEELRFILIDPKMLELSIYDGIPHLLTPVITDMKDAANALRWCVAEMDKRYRLMAALGVRNVAGYNQKVMDAIKQGEPLTMPGALVTDEESARTELQSLPMIVVIIDELADMMMVVGKKVEDLIARIAQKARAAGIHLIVATQRPSVDVITGLIKANIPTRVAFQVSSRIDSRTILDQQGAEQLLGHGDMLYLPPGAGVPIRVHGAYVADEEVHRVVAAWRSSGQPDYIHDVTEEVGANNGDGTATGEQDPLYDEAVRVVTESRRASISLVQRRLRIGYNRAARMMEDMEAAGVVSSMDNSGSREVLVGEVND